MIASRRGFITGLAALIAAPAVVKAASLMPVRAINSHQAEMDKLMVQFYQHIEYETEMLQRAIADAVFYGEGAFSLTEHNMMLQASHIPIGDKVLIRVPQVFTVRQ